MKLYTVKDKVSTEYAPPFLARTDMSAIRTFQHMLQGDKIAYAEDFELYRIGDFDIDTGSVQGCAPVLLDTPFSDKE